MEISRHLITVHTTGTHEDFQNALGERIDELVSDNGATDLRVRAVGHAMASHEGELHFSAVLAVDVEPA
jgi:hypothetical protein